MEKLKPRREFTRRQVIKGALGALGVSAVTALAGCLPGGKETPVPAETPTPIPTVNPTETPLPTEAPTRTPTLEPTPTFTPTPEPTPEFKGLELEGFEKVWNPEAKRWEYGDGDGEHLVYWDEKMGRIELIKNRPPTVEEFLAAWRRGGDPEAAKTFRRLDFERHRSLFVGWAAKQAEKAFLEALMEGIIAVPIPFEITKGEIADGQLASSDIHDLVFYDLPVGTTFVAPFSGRVIKSNPDLVTEKGFKVISNKQEFAIQAGFYWECFEKGFWGERDVKAGEPVLRTVGEKNHPGLPDYFWLSKKEPPIAELNIIDKNGNERDFTFEHLLRDEKGRFVYITQ